MVGRGGPSSLTTPIPSNSLLSSRSLGLSFAPPPSLVVLFEFLLTLIAPRGL